MSSKKEKRNAGSVQVLVSGIRYEEFAKIKWQQFLRFYSAVVMLIVIAAVVLMVLDRAPSEIPLAGVVVIVLLILTVLAIYRSGIRKEYKRSGLAGMELSYTFDRDGWTVRQGGSKATVPWKNTLKLKRNQNALLLYPNKKSVNIVPLRCLRAGEMEKIIGFCTGKNK